MVPIRASATLSQSENAQAFRILLFSNKTIRICTVGAVLLLVACVTFLLLNGFPSETAHQFEFAGLALPAAAFLGMIWRLPAVTTRQLWKSSPEFSKPVVWTFDATGVEIAHDMSKTTASWDAFSFVRERSALLFLHRSVGRAFYVPERAFAPVDLIEVRKLLRNKLGDRANVKN